MTTTEKTALVDVCSELENTQAEFIRIFDMLNIFAERLEGDLEFLAECADSYAKHAVRRYDALRSLMEVMQFHMAGAIDSMRQQIDAGYAMCKEEQATVSK